MIGAASLAIKLRRVSERGLWFAQRLASGGRNLNDPAR
jgi:hypothetical protein